MIRKLVLVICLTLFSAFSVFSEISWNFDFGGFTPAYEYGNNKSNLKLYIQALNIYAIDNKSGLYVAGTPFMADILFPVFDERNSFAGFSCKMNGLWLCNFETGWMKNISRYFLFEPFVGINALNIIKIEDVKISTGIELSWADISDCDKDGFSFLSKFISLRTGVQFCSTEILSPIFYGSVNFNLMFLSGVLN